MAKQIKLAKNTADAEVTETRKNIQLWRKILVFLCDLHHFKESPDSRSRLDLMIDPSYIDLPYFEPAEAKLLKSIVVEGKGITLEERVIRLIKNLAVGGDHRVYTSHDLAPLFEGAFGVSAKDLRRGKKFWKVVKESGIDCKAGI